MATAAGEMMECVAALVSRGVLCRMEQLTQCCQRSYRRVPGRIIALADAGAVTLTGAAFMRALPIFRGQGPALLVLMSTFALSGTAGAQFGVLRRAAERRVEQKVDDQANIAMLIEPTFDNTTIEITEERLDKYQAAMEKRGASAAANRAAAEAAAKRVELMRDSARAVERPAERAAYERSAQRYDECRSGVKEQLDEAAEEKSRALMMQMQTNPSAAQTDPKLKEMFALVQEMGTAQSKGDTAGMQRAQARLQALLSVVTDSASIDRSAVSKCGARPAKPASMVQADALTARADTLGRAASGQGGGGNGVAGSAVGMTDLQARMLWERVQSWLYGMRKDAPLTVTFTRNEYNLLVSRRSAIRKAFGGAS